MKKILTVFILLSMIGMAAASCDQCIQKAYHRASISHQNATWPCGDGTNSSSIVWFSKGKFLAQFYIQEAIIGNVITYTDYRVVNNTLISPPLAIVSLQGSKVSLSIAGKIYTATVKAKTVYARYNAANEIAKQATGGVSGWPAFVTNVNKGLGGCEKTKAELTPA